MDETCDCQQDTKNLRNETNSVIMQMEKQHYQAFSSNGKETGAAQEFQNAILMSTFIKDMGTGMAQNVTKSEAYVLSHPLNKRYRTRTTNRSPAGLTNSPTMQVWKSNSGAFLLLAGGWVFPSD